MFRCTLFFHWTPNRTADALFHHWHISNVHVKIPEQFNATTEDFYNSNVDGNACRAMMAFQSWWHTVLAPNYVSSRTWHLRDRYQATYQYGSGIYWILTVIVFSWNDVHLRKKTMRRNSGFNDCSPCLGFNYTVFVLWNWHKNSKLTVPFHSGKTTCNKFKKVYQIKHMLFNICKHTLRVLNSIDSACVLVLCSCF